jgi:mRNA interferase MazF
MTIKQGDIYWLQTSASDIAHPHVVIAVDSDSVMVCAVTSNMKKINMPGSVLLEAGEANLPKQSIVEVSKISTVHKTQLGDYIGILSDQRVQQILAGMGFVQRSFFNQ